MTIPSQVHDSDYFFHGLNNFVIIPSLTEKAVVMDVVYITLILHVYYDCACQYQQLDIRNNIICSTKISYPSVTNKLMIMFSLSICILLIAPSGVVL
jgi:hypothetical protein